MSIENCTDEELNVLHQAVQHYSEIDHYSNYKMAILVSWIDAITQEIKDREFEKTKEL